MMERLERQTLNDEVLGSFLMCVPFDWVSLLAYLNDKRSVNAEVSVRQV